LDVEAPLSLVTVIPFCDHTCWLSPAETRLATSANEMVAVVSAAEDVINTTEKTTHKQTKTETSFLMCIFILKTPLLLFATVFKVPPPLVSIQ
jgi:hypothetical protein